MKIALVTGANGFVGRHLVSALAVNGWVVYGICRSAVQTTDVDYRGAVKWLVWEDLPSLRFSEHELNQLWVFHAAANISVEESLRSPETVLEGNVGLTLAILKFIRETGIRKVVYFSSDRVFGGNAGEVDERSIPCPSDPYGLSKCLGEELIAVWADRYQFDAFILRSVSLYGQGQSQKQLLGKIFYEFTCGKRHFTIRDLSGGRMLLHVSDLVKGVLKITERPRSESGCFTYHFDGSYHSLVEITETVADIASKQFGVKVTFESLSKRRVSHKSDLGYDLFLANWTRNELDWQPLEDLRMGVADTMAIGE